MGSIIDFSEVKKNNKLFAALKYAELGWYVFPCWHVVFDSQGKAGCSCGNPNCKNPGKHPLSDLVPQGQNNATIDPEKIKTWWGKYPEANIAIFLARSGLCAVDIDPRNGGDFTIEDLEAEHGKIDSDVIALTGGGGEHRIFLRPQNSSRFPGRLGKGVDFKDNGYAIAPPSNHVSGRLYCWEASCDPFEGHIPSPLPDWIRDLAPNDTPIIEGSAQQVLLESEVNDLLAALQYIGSDDRDTWLNVGMALHSTGDRRAYQWWCDWSEKSTKFDSKDQYRVWRSFRLRGLDGIGIATIFKLAVDNGYIATIPTESGLPPSGMVIVDDDDITKGLASKSRYPDFPAVLNHFPVFALNELRDWINGFSEEPQPQISMIATLAAACTVTGRIYRSDHNNPTNCYFILTAGTGVGKNYAKNAIKRILTECCLQKFLSGSGNTSAGAVFSALFESPNHIQMSDEFGKHLQMARKQTNGAMADAFAVLTEAYSDATESLIPRNYSSFHLDKKQRQQMDKKVVYAPSITLFAFATHEQIYNNLTTSEIDDGFLNRFMVINAHLPTAPEQDLNIQPLSADLKRLITQIARPNSSEMTGVGNLQGIDTEYDVEPSPITVQTSEQAKKLFKDFKREIKQNEIDGQYIEPKLTRRWRENAMRLATCLAVWDNPNEPFISSQVAQWCIEFVRYYGTCSMLDMAMNVADNDFHRLYKVVLDLVQRSEHKGMTERDLSKYSRLFAATPLHMRDQVLAVLKREGLIDVRKRISKSGRGRATVAYFACEFLEDGIE